MNICMLTGKIISEIEFNFIIKSEKTSIVIFTIEVDEKYDIIVKAYDEIADWCYQNLETKDIVTIKGRLDGKMQIIIEEIEKFI